MRGMTWLSVLCSYGMGWVVDDVVVSVGVVQYEVMWDDVIVVVGAERNGVGRG